MSKRKIITVPKDKDSEVALDYDTATTEQLIEVFLDQTEFMELYRAGFFQELNFIADALIDEYESEAITDKEKIQLVLDSDIFNKPVLVDKLNQIKNLFQEALQRNTGVYFYF
ncbi:hypothetical protein SAMN05428949_1320 [Chitinophaga sp. YR627]|uniref:hypothetical protein n=1 Tax=Chitinophaga sp. YR627 TaxID=1881041 RepID=UPI0008E10A5D|nr:hypothetical protein [Chitinophaga sp. YR627]SFM92224.1 hypothetical protein SAMN05428949_1320 [Chitinophaga sp. YR627]